MPQTLQAWPSRLILSVAAAALALPAAAIQPQRWVHSTEADFTAGEAQGVVVTNLGDVKLATAAQTLGELPEGVSILYDLATVGGTTFVAAGPEGRLLRLDDGEVTEVAAFEDQQAFTLLANEEDGSVTVGLSGETSRLVTYGVDGEVKRQVELPDVRYVWDLLAAEGGGLIVATGSEGLVLRVDPQGDVQTLLDTAQANVLCLAGGLEGSIYAGTDTDGLVYRIDGEGKAYVVYDASEPEVAALLVAEDGTLYVGTADAEQARPGRLGEAASQETGRPEAGTTPATAGDASPTDPVVEPPSELPVEPAPQPLADPAVAEPRDDPSTMQETGTQGETPDASGSPAAADAGGNEDVVATEANPAPQPTDEQYDALREELRRRLQAARGSGGMAAATRPTRRADPARSASAPGRGGARGGGRAGAAQGDKSGNAVYRIDPQGFVSEVFRESVMVLKITQGLDGKLLIATGNEGQLFRVDPAAGETSVLNDLEPQQLLALGQTPDGRVLVAGSNPAALVALSATPAESGTFTSAALDAGQVSLWGTLNLTAFLADGGSVRVETRSGNVADPQIAGWSDWAEAGTATAVTGRDPWQPFEFKSASPPARFTQYRLTLSGGDGAGEARRPLAVERVELAYVTPNLRPSLTSLTAAYPPFAGVDQPASTSMPVAWEATDDNGDRLTYRLEFRPAATDHWQTLAEDLTDTSYDWETRRVPDGRYRLRVTASDQPDNPGAMAMTASRLTEPVLVDNTPPRAEGLNVVVSGGTASVSGVAKDDWSTIRSVAYLLDEAKAYVPVLPDDLIYDSTVEAFSVILPDLSQGGHTLTLRLLDDRGNATYVSQLFEVKQ